MLCSFVFGFIILFFSGEQQGKTAFNVSIGILVDLESSCSAGTDDCS
jgi:hypothetical protein